MFIQCDEPEEIYQHQLTLGMALKWQTITSLSVHCQH